MDLAAQPRSIAALRDMVRGYALIALEFFHFSRPFGNDFQQPLGNERSSHFQMSSISTLRGAASAAHRHLHRIDVRFVERGQRIKIASRGWVGLQGHSMGLEICALICCPARRPEPIHFPWSFRRSLGPGCPAHEQPRAPSRGAGIEPHRHATEAGRFAQQSALGSCRCGPACLCEA